MLLWNNIMLLQHNIMLLMDNHRLVKYPWAYWWLRVRRLRTESP